VDARLPPPLIMLSRQDLAALRTNLREQCRAQPSASHKFAEAKEQDREKT